MVEMNRESTDAAHRAAVERAEALLDGLLAAWVANQRAREQAGVNRSVDVARQRLSDSIARTRELIDRLNRIDSPADTMNEPGEK